MGRERLNLIEKFRSEFIKEDIPEFLYHYTSIEGFKGIIDSKEIWATAADYLFEDPSEITIAKSIAREIIEKCENDLNEKGLLDICQKSIESSVISKEYQFISSFSEEGDLLSQWRAYCPKGGVSLGFTIPRISENDQYLYTKNGSYHDELYVHENYIYKCIYDIQEQKQKIIDLFFRF